MSEKEKLDAIKRDKFEKIKKDYKEGKINIEKAKHLVNSEVKDKKK